MTHLLTNATVYTGRSSGDVINRGAVAWEDDRIVAVGDEADLRDAHPDARVIDGRGGLAVPGFINLHHHFYSALARGLDPGGPIADFGENLRRLWWRLDRALDAETVRLSALLTAAAALRAGCTTVFDHHASPACIQGSLDIVARAVGECGLSAVLCYEVSDRNGHDEALAGIEENARFIGERLGDARIRGMMGLHASFTLTDETLDEARRRMPQGCGCHIHVAEDALDVRHSQAAFGAGPVERLDRSRLLDGSSLLIHGVHLSPASLHLAAERGAVLVHNPESNANNGVGRLDIRDAADTGITLGLGTDGMGGSMLRSARAAFLGLRSGRGDPTQGFDVVPGMLFDANAAVAGRFFEEPNLGTLRPNAPADIAVLDASPPTPISRDNLFGHLIYGAADAPVRHTIARGRILLEDFDLTRIDLTRITEQAWRATPALWDRFRALSPDTPLPGGNAGERE